MKQLWISIWEIIRWNECLSYHHIWWKKGRWAVFKCSCGKQFSAVVSQVKHKRIISCGCKRTCNRKEPWVSLYNSAISKIKANAIKRWITRSLTQEEAVSIVKSHCVYCWDIWGNTSTNKQCQLWSIKFNGIDRVDSAIWYTTVNSVACCKYCNRWKNSMSAKEFLAHVSKIYNYNQQ